jgi:hypothetical protein
MILKYNFYWRTEGEVRENVKTNEAVCPGRGQEK